MGLRTSRAAVLAAVIVAATACGSDGNQGAADDEADSVETSSTDAVALFDSDVVHTIEVEFDEADYDAMVETFTETGEKESIEATVTIDGATYEQAGLRLKGNSSLAGLGGRFGPGGAGGRPDGEAAADGATETEDTEETTTTSTTERPTNTSATDGSTSSSVQDRQGGQGDGFGPAGGASADEPEHLPWLIELDEFVDQSHEGYEDIVIRSNGSETSLNEAVALDLLEEAGVASQEAMATSFSVNGSEPVLRLAIEHPDDDAWYERAFDDADGALYKAESTGDWSYRGDDPEVYDEVFDQEGGEDVADLAPLIEFLEFINESDDATFASELPDRLDIDAFATYLAMMELVDNFDDIDGPGNNGYLWWDATTEQFTVVPWDLNLAFGGAGGGFGGQPGDGMEPPEGFDPSQLPDGMEPPEGFDPSQLPDGMEPPEGSDPSQLPDDFEPGQGPGGGDGGGFGGRSNVLVERFHANAEFEAIYEERLTELRDELYSSGVADEILDGWVETLTDTATDLVDEDTIAEEAASIRDQFSAE